MPSPSVTTFTDRCLACQRPFQSTWGSRTGYCSSSCNLALLVIRSGAYVSPRYQGNQVRFVIQTREHPSPQRESERWIAYTSQPADLARPVLDVWEGAGQFAGEGDTEIDAVLDLIESIEAAS